MNRFIRPGIGLLVITWLAAAIPATAQEATRPSVLTLPVTGTFARGGEFKGTVSINRFEQRGADIVAIGLVAGVLSRGSHHLGTAVAGEVTWSVQVSSGGATPVGDRAAASPRLMRVALSDAPPMIRRAQAEACPVLNVSLLPNTVDLLGAQVALSGITLDLVGATGTPLGDLICAASGLLSNVAALVEVLNSLLGLVTGLLGGLLGGLGGIVP